MLGLLDGVKSNGQHSQRHTKAGHACLSLNKMIRCTFIGFWLTLNEEERGRLFFIHSMHNMLVTQYRVTLNSDYVFVFSQVYFDVNYAYACTRSHYTSGVAHTLACVHQNWMIEYYMHWEYMQCD